MGGINTRHAGTIGAVILALLGAMPTLAGTVEWDGGGDGSSWNDAANWSGDEVPGSFDDVIIDVPGSLTVNDSGSQSHHRSDRKGRLSRMAPERDR